jgi:hypothetical protein
VSDLTPLALAPASLYLALVTLLLATTGRCPAHVHTAALAVGIPTVALLVSWPSALLAAAAAAVVFLPAVLVAGRMLTGTGLFSLTVTLALLPLTAWPFAAAGLLLAAAVGAWRTARLVGAHRVTMLTGETMAAVGLRDGTLAKPDLGRLPTRADAEQMAVMRGVQDDRRTRMYLPPYLLAALLAAAAGATIG